MVVMAGLSETDCSIASNDLIRARFELIGALLPIGSGTVTMTCLTSLADESLALIARHTRL